MQLVDSIGRKINYLRLSVTDRCNMRCLYCMPPEGVKWRNHSDILTYEELLTIAETSVSIGIEKIRLTGGEPLIRPGIVGFIANLSKIEKLKHIALTTNALLLDDMAQPLFDAGLQRLNISLDSLEQERFSKITRGGDLQKVLKGIDAAQKAGFPNPKINCVVMRGINDDEIYSFAKLSAKRDYSVRFIEYMPVVKEDGWERFVISGSEIIEKLSEKFDLEELDKGRYSGPSKDYRIAGKKGSIGIITAVSGHFCGSCNRIRVTSTGEAKGCLFADSKTDLKPYLRPIQKERLAETIREIVHGKPLNHTICGNIYKHKNFVMADIGG